MEFWEIKNGQVIVVIIIVVVNNFWCGVVLLKLGKIYVGLEIFLIFCWMSGCINWKKNIIIYVVLIYN